MSFDYTAGFETRCEAKGDHVAPRVISYERDHKVTVARWKCGECGKTWTTAEQRRRG